MVRIWALIFSFLTIDTGSIQAATIDFSAIVPDASNHAIFMMESITEGIAQVQEDGVAVCGYKGTGACMTGPTPNTFLIALPNPPSPQLVIIDDHQDS